MREIKFRGKRIANGEWVCGLLFISHHEHNPSNGIYIFTDEYNPNWYGSRQPYKVDPETIGQYSGLKDKNGKDIYEGDVVEYKSKYYSRPLTKFFDKKLNECLISNNKRSGIIEYNEGAFSLGYCLKLHDIRTSIKIGEEWFYDRLNNYSEEGENHCATYREVYSDFVKVGNIYDNPELLEECKQ